VKDGQGEGVRKIETFPVPHTGNGSKDSHHLSLVLGLLLIQYS
jgi:hypothetical protein